MTTAQLDPLPTGDRADHTGQQMPGDDLRGYRDALGTFGTGVCLVSMVDPTGNAHAITVNSFTSVSLNPPMVLWCLDERSSQYERFANAGHFSISMLAADQRGLSDMFAKAGRPLLSPDQFDLDTHNVPLIRGSLARLSCRTAWREVAGDHLLIVAHVLGFDRPRRADGLGYFSGGYTVNSRP